MTTLYRPVLIESADLPMDKFPEGTIATHPDHWPVERCSCSRWESEGPDRYDPDMVGFTALVPIEAEEETVVAIEPGNPYAEASMDSDGNVWFGDGIFPVDVTEKFNQWASKNQRTRYVTPWEEA